MKKIPSFIFAVLVFFIILPSSACAQISSLPKPITGTFTMFDISFPTVEGWYPYFDEMKQAGIDTVIITGMGSVNKYSEQYASWNHFDDGTMEKFLQAAHDKNFLVYAGLVTNNWEEIRPDRGDPNDPNTDRGYLISVSLQLTERLKQLCLSKGWGWDNNFVKGFYLPQELPVDKFTYNNYGDGWPEYFAYYQMITGRLKNRYPTKLVLLSPYFNSRNTYESVYNNIKHAIASTQIDIYAPQDGNGAGVGYNKSRENYRALADAVRDGNLENNKQVLAWANIESFSPSTDGGKTFPPPSNIQKLDWQIRAVEPFVSKQITWIYSWSLAINPQLENNGIQYTPDYAAKRKTLRKDYLSRPILTNAFNWTDYSPTAFVVYGYNLGPLGSFLGVYIHYYDSNNQPHSFQKTGYNLIYNLNVPFMEIRLPLSDLPGFDLSRPFDIAVLNQENQVSYYRSVNHDTMPEPSFPEINFFPSPTTTITPSSTPIPPSITPTPTLSSLNFLSLFINYYHNPNPPATVDLNNNI